MTLAELEALEKSIRARLAILNAELARIRKQMRKIKNDRR